MSGAGLKKCIPINRSGLLSDEAKLVMEIEEVFDAKIQSLLTMDSNFINNSFLVLESSIIASIIRSDY